MKILKFLFSWLFEKQPLVIKGGVNTITFNEPARPKRSKKWGTKVPRYFANFKGWQQ